MARKKKHEEHENHERWLISYADFITLLFAFFVVMYSLSAVNEGKFRVLAASLASSFRGPPPRSMEPIQLGSSAHPSILQSQATATPIKPMMPLEYLQHQPSHNPIKLETINENTNGDAEAAGETGTEDGAGAMQEIAESIEVAMQYLIDQNLVRVKRFKYWLEIEINTNILYQSGSASLENYAIPILKNIAQIVHKYSNPIHVEGFTDNVPINTYQYPSNWELSAARATSVLHLFIDEGIAPTRLAAVGHGEFNPAASNETASGRMENRKVVLVILANESVGRLHDGLEKITDGAPELMQDPAGLR
jgi:chemotaxis protein MotB